MKSFFHNLVRSGFGLLWGLLTLTGATAVGGEVPSTELLDLAGRIEYGFYTEERRAIDTARSGLARLSGQGPLQDYYAGLGAYRAALLRASDEGRGLGALLSECMDSADDAAQDRDIAGEAWILLAACSALGARFEPSKSRLYQHRFESALAAAADVEPDNPRILVVSAWALSHRPAHEEPELRDVTQERLEQALERFAAWETPFGFPSWGEAEALAHLGEIRLVLGDARGARDFIEHALLVAPDYRFAVTLQKRVVGN